MAHRLGTIISSTYAAVKTQFKILGKEKSLDSCNVTNVEEPNVSQDLSLESQAFDNSAEHVDADFGVGRRVDSSEL